MRINIKKSKKKVKFKLSPLFISLLSVYPESTVFAQDIVVDPSNNNGLNVTATANDTPLVQIAEPNAKGVSHNKFTDFNVSRPGVVFNNSMQDGVSQIGGMAMKNPNLTQAASGIISEVTGAKASRLEGTLEVFGQQADLVIANENGIVVNGLSTINTGHLTLSTGQVMQQADGSYRLAVERGNVSVESGGVSTTDLDYFDIVSRSARLNGKISGKADVKVLTGLNDYDPQSRSHRVRANRGVDTPEVAISGSSMGSMYGNRIQLISTESGAGVRHQGSIISDSDIEISASGDISLAGLKAGQDITVSGDNLALLNQSDSSGISAQRDLFINALNQLTLRSDLVSRQGKVRIDAGSLLQQAAVIQTNAAATDIDTITINVMGDYSLSGTLKALDATGNVINNAAIVLRDGDYVVTVDGQNVPWGKVIADVGVNAKQGNIAIQSASIDNQHGSLGADAGTIAFNVSDVFTTNGVIKAQGNISLISRSLVNNGIARSSGKLNINVSDLANRGSLSADKNVHLAASNALDNSGVVASNQSIVLSGKDVTNTGSLVSQNVLNATTKNLLNKGKVHTTGDMTLRVDSTLTNRDGGEIVSGETLIINGKDTIIDNISDATVQAKNITLTGVRTVNNGDSAQFLMKEMLSVDRLNTLSNSGTITAGDMALNNIESVNNDGQLIATNTLLLLAKSVKNKGGLKSNDLLSITASQVSNTGGILQAGGEMQIDARQLQNSQGGNLFSKKGMTLALTRALKNIGSVVATGGKLIIRAADNAQNLSVLNSDGAELSATDVVLSSVGDLTNTNSVIGAAESLKVSGLATLNNSGSDAVMQAATIAISDANSITNTGMLFAKSKITLDNAASLDNTGIITSDGDLTINNVKKVDNAAELIAGSNLHISDADTLTNSETIAADRLTLKDIASIDNSNILKAQSQLDITKINNLKNNGLVYSSDRLTIEDVIRFINTSAREAETEALVYAESEMVIQRISDLVNSGDTAVINAFGRLQLLDIAQLSNSDRAVINGDLALILDKIGILTNLSAANITSQNGSIKISPDKIVNSGHYTRDVYNDNGVLIDRQDSPSLILALNDVTIHTSELTNMDGAVLDTEDGDIFITSDSLINAYGGAISVRGDIILTVLNDINNAGSSIYGRNIYIEANQLINNAYGQISANNNVFLKLNTLTHDGGRIVAAENLRLDINDNFSFAEASLNANANLIINSTKNITNGTRLENYGSLSLHADKYFVNRSGGSLVSAGDISITAANFTNEKNTLVWSLGDLSIDVRNGKFVNKQNGNIYSNKAMSLIAKSILNYAGYIKSGADMDIDARELTNNSIYDNQGWSLADNVYLEKMYKYKTSLVFVNEDLIKMNLPKWQADITLVGKAEIRAGGYLKINQRDIYSNNKVTNTGGLLSSVRDVFITGNVVNEPDYIKMTLLEYITSEFDITGEHHFYGAPQTHQNVPFKTLYGLLDYVYGNTTAALDHKDKYYYVLLGLEKNYNPFELVMTRLFGETWRNLSWKNMRSKWAALIQNNGQKIADEVVYFLPSDRGSITSGGTLNHNGGSFSNGITNGGVVKRNKVVDVDIGDKNVKTTDVGAQVAVNQKILAVVNLGISTLPTIRQLTSIPGMFGNSAAFKKLITGLVAPEDIGSFGAFNVVIGDASLTVVPMYETRLDMIDKSQFYGSDYFFKQIEYVAEKPVIVIGDNYFINELINRQVSVSVGSFFAVRDGLDNEALVKVLMDNAAKVSDKLGLAVGQPLTEEQRNNLDEDIVWFVKSNVERYEVLTPVVYLSNHSQQQLRDGGASAVVHANENVNIDATLINNANGIISADKNADLKAEGDILIASSGQDSGVKAGGDISMASSKGDISVSGSYIKSGGDIDITAGNGDVSFIASMNRDEEGNHQLHSNKDGVSAGGNLNISGKNVEFNAVDVEAGGDASIAATDGTVSFNALQEIISDREVDYKDNGLFSDERTDKQTISSEVLTSNIKAGGNVSIKAKDDINIEGSEMTASGGEMTAGNDINIKTAEEVSWEKTTVEKNELVFGASTSGFGHSAKTESSTLDGTSNATSTGYENNSTEGGGSAGRGKSNGAASIPSAAEFKAGLQKTIETTEKQSTTNHNANLNFGHSGSLTAAGTVDIGGGDFTMDEMSIDAANVASTKYVDETKKTTSSTHEFWGGQGECHSTIADAANKYTNLGMDTVGGDKEVNSWEVAFSAISDSTNIYFNDLAGGSASIGYERKESGSTTVKGQENTTNINVGNLTIKSQEDTKLNGVATKADNVSVAAGGDLNINSAKSWENEESWSATNRAGLSKGAGAGFTGAGVGVSIDYSHYEEQASSESVSHTNSQINAGNVNMSVGGDMTMAGAHIAAGEANINVGGDLNIVSQQDTLNSKGSSWQTTESLGIALSTSGVIPIFAAGGGGGDEYRNEALVGEQSGITTSGAVNITTGNDLNIIGGHIVSEESLGSVNVGGNINATTLADSVEQDGLYGGASVGIDKKGSVVGSGYVKTIEEVHYKENQKATLDVGNVTAGGKIKGELNTDSSNMSEVTEDRVVAGSDISWTLGGKLPAKGKGSGSASAPTPDSHSGNGSGSGAHTNPGTNSGSGRDTESGNAHTDSGANPEHSSSNDNTSGNSIATSDRPNGNTVYESPTDSSDTGHAPGTDATTDPSETRPKLQWMLTPQGNLKGGTNVGTIKDVGNVTAGGKIKGELNTDSSNMSEVTEDRVVAGSDISWTLGGKLPAKGKGSGSASAPTPDSHSGNGSGSGAHTNPGTNSGSGRDTESGNAHTDSGANPEHSSSNDNTSGNSIATSDRPNGNTVYESPTDSSDTGHAPGTDATTDPSETRPKLQWMLTPQGNLKGGTNVGTIKDTDAIRKKREFWENEYQKRNNMTEE